MIQGFSHVGVSTHNMERTIAFYEDLLGFRRVVDETVHVNDGGTLRQLSFDVGGGQYMVFMECNNVRGISDDYDTGINRALGLPSGMYHYAFREPSFEALEARRARLLERGVEVSDVIDLGAALAVFLQDCNGIQLEFVHPVRPFDETDIGRVSHAEIAHGE
ncbi:Glyoxalase/Bleomycin resistance protein/Dioxygenase superfamily protein [Caballeronia arationis]|uniref:VOC family protein n=1 Tax=Caballeronia arationis TaxID=1777142 RepID=UPI00074CB2A3|nr:VOC family protein [Caballeronia arationis]SAL04286.1 Glyoxalase/Bleomycin resistance protein/Dioxygenase superfamily protein [Caballeronia arationis]